MTSNKPLVSVIIIFLDGEEFIQEAIESVFAQTYDNWDLLLVDDGSTDGSTNIALQYAEQHGEKVRYLEHDNHQNRGMSASRNLGSREAKGEHIAFLDADDVYLPKKLEQQVAILNSHPTAAMVYGATQHWHSWTGKSEDLRRDYRRNLGVPPDTLVQPPTLPLLFLRDKAATPGTCGVLVRREAIERVGGFEENFRGMFEDQVFFYKLCLSAPVFVESGSWDRYRQHQNSHCEVSRVIGVYDPERRHNPAYLAFLNWLEAYLTEQRVTNRELWKAFRAAIWPYHHPILYKVSHLATQTEVLLKRIVRWTLPAPVRRWLRAHWHGSEYCPPVGSVRLGNLQRVMPISRTWGFDRGLPIDRYYIERFLFIHALDVRGYVLEIQDNTYTCKFGGERVTRSDVLHAVEGNPQATIVADLTCADHIPSDTFDCVILTQTLQFIYDVRAALKTLYRTLKPGGVLLATFPGISQISRSDMDRWGDYWRFTTLSSRKLLEEIFPAERVAVEAYGNVLAAIAFLHGLAAQELHQKDLDSLDPDYEILITARAVKPEVTV